MSKTSSSVARWDRARLELAPADPGEDRSEPVGAHPLCLPTPPVPQSERTLYGVCSLRQKRQEEKAAALKARNRSSPESKCGPNSARAPRKRRRHSRNSVFLFRFAARQPQGKLNVRPAGLWKSRFLESPPATDCEKNPTCPPGQFAGRTWDSFCQQQS